jgi:hypothetical protein
LWDHRSCLHVLPTKSPPDRYLRLEKLYGAMHEHRVRAARGINDSNAAVEIRDRRVKDMAYGGGLPHE